MSTIPLPQYTLTPDMFGAIAKDIIVPDHANTEAGILKWLSETAQKQIGGTPDLSSKAVAERLNISRRTLEGYRIGNPMPLATCWLLAALVRELRNSASGLVLRSTPSETATRESATQLSLQLQNLGVQPEMTKRVTKPAKTTKKAGKPAATRKTPPSQKKRNPSTESKSPLPSKSKPSSKTKSPSKKSKSPSSKQRKPSSK